MTIRNDIGAENDDSSSLDEIAGIVITATPQICLNGTERLLLGRWAEQYPRIRQPIYILLALAAGETVKSVAARLGVAKCTVYGWRRRFQQCGVEAIAPTLPLHINEAQRQQLEEWQSGPDARLAKRASLILCLLETSNLTAAARQCSVTTRSAHLWRSAFARGGIRGLLPVTRQASASIRKLTPDELSILEQWATATRRYALRAKIILALAAGDAIESVASRLSISRTSVYNWRQRFNEHGLEGIATCITDVQRQQLEECVSGSDPKVAKRASLILHFATHGDLRAASLRAGLGIATARKWLNAFAHDGVAGVNPAKPPLIAITQQELTELSRWAEAKTAVATRAKVILGLAAAESIRSAGRSLGVNESTALYWRKRFRRGGLKALAPTSILVLSAEQQCELEQCQLNTTNPKLAQRASLILNAARLGDLVSAAKRADVSLSAARLWQRRFAQSGLHGLDHPKADSRPVTRRKRRLAPFCLTRPLGVDVQLDQNDGYILLHGTTTAIDRRHVTITFGPHDNAIVRNLNECRVVATIHWPAVSADGGRMVLSIEGTSIGTDAAGAMRIKIRRSKFGPPPEDIASYF